MASLPRIFAVDGLRVFLTDAVDDDTFHDAFDDVVALEMQRFEANCAEQLMIDEAIAYSLAMEYSRRLFENGDDFSEVEMDFGCTKAADPKPPTDCSCCTAPIPALSQRRIMPCGHLYCLPCVQTRCKMGIHDRSLVPAHCCKKEFPTEYVRETLTHSEWKQYERYIDERTWTKHGLELVSDTEYATVVQKLGGRQCPKCGVGVERLSGCLAMKCLRGHWFCWNCGQYPCSCGAGTGVLRQHGQ